MNINQPEPIEKPSERKRKRLTSAILGVLMVIVILLIFLIHAYVSEVMKNLEVEEFKPEDVAINQETLDKINQYNNKITNVLLIGIDSDMGKHLPQRSDSMNLLSIDDKHKSIKISSLMRDTFVEIEGHGTDKLNHSYAFGGTKLLLKTINQSFDLDVTEYVLVDFNNLVKIIDYLGGVELTLTKEEAKSANISITRMNKKDGLKIPHFKVKDQTVLANGVQALSYARIRYIDTDYKRSERQRIVLGKILDRVKQKPATELPDTIRELSKYAKTTLNEMEILNLANKAMDSSMIVHGRHFPTSSASKEVTKGSWHIEYDKEKTVKQIHEYIFQDIDPKTNAAIDHSKP